MDIRPRTITILSFLRLTVVRARLFFFMFAALFINTAYIDWDSATAGQPLFAADAVILFVIGIFLLMFGWLAFSSNGKALLVESVRYQEQAPPILRILKVLWASLAMAMATWMVLVIGALFLGGANLVIKLFTPWPAVILTVIYFPFAYRRLK